MPERLVDHEQVEGVKLLQVLNLVQRVGGIRVTTEHDFRPTRADFGENFHVPTRLALDLDSAVAGIQFSFNFLQQLFVRVFNANGNTAWYFLVRSAPQLPPRDLSPFR